MVTPTTRQEHLAAAIALVQNIDSPEEQLVATTEMLAELQQAVKDVGAIRTDAVRTLNNLGWGYAKLAAIGGFTKGRVQQLLHPEDTAPPKRAGVMEARFRLEAAEMKAKGMSATQRAEALVPQIRGHRGGKRVSSAEIADWLTVSEFLVDRIIKREVSAA